VKSLPVSKNGSPGWKGYELSEGRSLQLTPPKMTLFLALSVMGVILVVYGLIFSRLPAAVFWSPDEGAKFLQLQTLRREAGQVDRIPYPGRQLDPAYRFYPRETDTDHPDHSVSALYPQPLGEGEVRFNWPVWFPWLSMLPWRLWGLPGLYFIPLASGLLTVALVGYLTYRLEPGMAALAMVIVGLASPIFFYSFLFWEHTLVVLMGLVALWLVMDWRPGRWLRPVLAGGVLAGAAMIRLEMVMYILALGGGVGLTLAIRHRGRWLGLSRRTKGAIIGSLGLIVVGFIAVLNLLSGQGERVFGLLGQKEGSMVRWAVDRFLAPVFWADVPRRLQEIWMNTQYPWDAQMPAPFYGLGIVGILICGGAIFFRGRGRTFLLLLGSVLLGLGSVYILVLPNRYRTVHGLFLVAPYLVLAFLALPYAWQKGDFARLVLSVATVLYLVGGSMGVVFGVPGGLEWGPRYLLMGYPLGAVCVALGLHHLNQTTRAGVERWCLGGLAALLLIVGGRYEVRGIQELQRTKADLSAYASRLAEAEQPVVTDLYWLPASLAPRFLAQEIYVLAYRADLPAWLTLATGRVDSFLFASFTPLEPTFYGYEVGGRAYLLVPKEQTVVQGLGFTEFRMARQE